MLVANELADDVSNVADSLVLAKPCSMTQDLSGVWKRPQWDMYQSICQ